MNEIVPLLIYYLFPFSIEGFFIVHFLLKKRYIKKHREPMNALGVTWRVCVTTILLKTPIFLFIGLIALAGRSVESSYEQYLNGEVKWIQSTESELVMAFPQSWRVYDDEPNNSIEMGYRVRNEWLTVEEYHYFDDFTLDEFSDLVLAWLCIDENAKENIAVQDKIIGDNIAAKQFEIVDVFEETEVWALVTCFEHDGIFYEIWAWTPKYRHHRAKSMFGKIIDSVSFERQTHG